jgi:hypothetical protein
VALQHSIIQVQVVQVCVGLCRFVQDVQLPLTTLAEALCLQTRWHLNAVAASQLVSRVHSNHCVCYRIFHRCSMRASCSYCYAWEAMQLASRNYSCSSDLQKAPGTMHLCFIGMRFNSTWQRGCACTCLHSGVVAVAASCYLCHFATTAVSCVCSCGVD